MKGARELKRWLRRQRLSRREGWLLLTGAIAGVLLFKLVQFTMPTPTALPYTKTGITATWIPATVKRWQAPIDQMAKKYNVDPNVLAILMTLESGGNPKAHSEADAVGLMQITPIAAKDIAQNRLQKPVSTYNLTYPATNIEFGAAYVAYLRDIFEDPTQGPSWNATMELVAAGYNGGPTAASNLYHGKGLTDTQTVVYSRDAFNMWRERHAADSPTYDRWLERGGVDLINAAKAAK